MSSALYLRLEKAFQKALRTVVKERRGVSRGALEVVASIATGQCQPSHGKVNLIGIRRSSLLAIFCCSHLHHCLVLNRIASRGTANCAWRGQAIFRGNGGGRFKTTDELAPRDARPPLESALPDTLLLCTLAKGCKKDRNHQCIGRYTPYRRGVNPRSTSIKHGQGPSSHLCTAAHAQRCKR